MWIGDSFCVLGTWYVVVLSARATGLHGPAAAHGVTEETTSSNYEGWTGRQYVCGLRVHRTGRFKRTADDPEGVNGHLGGEELVLVGGEVLVVRFETPYTNRASAGSRRLTITLLPCRTQDPRTAFEPMLPDTRHRSCKSAAWNEPKTG